MWRKLQTFSREELLREELLLVTRSQKRAWMLPEQQKQLPGNLNVNVNVNVNLTKVFLHQEVHLFGLSSGNTT